MRWRESETKEKKRERRWERATSPPTAPPLSHVTITQFTQFLLGISSRSQTGILPAGTVLQAQATFTSKVPTWTFFFLSLRYEKQLEQEEQAFQQQRRRLYAEVQEEKERVALQAQKQRQELDEARAALEVSGYSLVSKSQATKEHLEYGQYDFVNRS